MGVTSRRSTQRSVEAVEGGRKEEGEVGRDMEGSGK